VTLPVVWIPEANEDLLAARAWYDNIRPELGECFALTVEAAVDAIAGNLLQFPASTGAVGGRECGAFRTAYSSRC
jgi:hypothetical protein